MLGYFFAFSHKNILDEVDCALDLIKHVHEKFVKRSGLTLQGLQVEHKLKVQEIDQLFHLVQARHV